MIFFFFFGVWSIQGSQFRTGSCTGLTSGMIYFGTSQYRYTVSGLPLYNNNNNNNKSLP